MQKRDSADAGKDGDDAAAIPGNLDETNMLPIMALSRTIVTH